MVFWVPESLPILSSDRGDASTGPLSAGVALSVGRAELRQARLDKRVGGASLRSAPGWSSEPLLGVSEGVACSCCDRWLPTV